MADPTATSSSAPDGSDARPAAAEIVVEAPPRWERLLDSAGGAAQPSSPTNALGPTVPVGDPAAVALPWIRALLPVLLLVVYVGYKVTHGPPAEPRRPDVELVRSLTGVEHKPGRHRMDTETRTLVVALEARVDGRNWSGIMNAVATAPPEVREHPVVQAFDAIARVESGEGGPDLMALLIALERELAGDEDLAPQVEYLRLARLISMFRTQGTTPDGLLRLTSEMRPSLSVMRTTPRVVEFRLMLAERFERFGQDEEAAAAGTFTNDTLRLATARQLYQQGLRWIVTREGWLKATPIAPGKPAVVVERLLMRIEKLNRQINGWSVPMTESDSSTWTGKRGDPIHDAPGGTW